MGARRTRAGGRRCARKATFLAFGFAALAAASASSSSAPQSSGVGVSMSVDTVSVSEAETKTETSYSFSTAKGRPVASTQTPEDAQAAEAARAYRTALATLANLTAHPPPYTADPSYGSAPDQHAPSLVSLLGDTLLPGAGAHGRGYDEGQGPIGSALRIAKKLGAQIAGVYKAPGRILSGLVGGIVGGGGGEGSGGSGDGYASRIWGKGGRGDEDMQRKAVKVLDLLQYAAELGNMDAVYVLGMVSLFPPNFYFPSDPSLAFSSFSTHATATGNGTSHAYLGFLYATGYTGASSSSGDSSIDQARALLHYTFGAHAGDPGAQAALAYRYTAGIGAQGDCKRSLEWWEGAAEHAYAAFLDGPPGGRTLPLSATRLSDLDGGVYGPGASVASVGMNVLRPAVKAGLAQTAGETWEDVLEYYIFNADRGELDFAYKLGRIYYQGSIYYTPGGIASGAEGVGRIEQDFSKALHYFLLVARTVWPRDPLANPLSTHMAPSAGFKVEGVTQPGWAHRAAAYLGRMYLRGEGVRKSAEMAMMWFERGAEYDDRECTNMLGVMWRDGLVPGRKDVVKAQALFAKAAGQELAEAQVNVAKVYYQRGEYKLAATAFDTAIRYGSPFEAPFYLGKLFAHSFHEYDAAGHADVARETCESARAFFKTVAERGAFAFSDMLNPGEIYGVGPSGNLLGEAEDLWASGTERGREQAMLRWWIAAERGSEIAQNNLAYVLDQDKSILRHARPATSPTLGGSPNESARIALTQWTRSASQRNVDALVKVGDYYYHGLGLQGDESEKVRFKNAAKYYQDAADKASALAMWNLGWMYENGVGVPQDFHLAKRHYDQALATNSEAYLPVMLSCAKLYARSLWLTIRGGGESTNLFLGEEKLIEATQGEHQKAEADKHAQREQQQRQAQELIEDEDAGSAWYMGKARDDFHRRRRQGVGMPQEDQDPIEYAREHRQALADELDYGPEDYFDGALRGGYRDEHGNAQEFGVEDELGETLLLVLLCVSVSVLIWIRARLVERARQQQQQLQAHAQAHAHANETEEQRRERERRQFGVFPPEGDPARGEWNILR